jgi:hypothetical protein
VRAMYEDTYCRWWWDFFLIAFAGIDDRTERVGGMQPLEVSWWGSSSLRLCVCSVNHSLEIGAKPAESQWLQCSALLPVAWNRDQAVSGRQKPSRYRAGTAAGIGQYVAGRKGT